MLSLRHAPTENAAWVGLPGELAAVTCYFNPCGYRALKRNYLEFAATFRAHRVPLYSIELAFDDQPFALPGGDRTWRVRGADVMWQKERLLNLLIERLPERFDKVAWIDADLLFTNAGWVEETARQLERFPIVQPFSEAVYLDREGRVVDVRPGVARAMAGDDPRLKGLATAHPGFAWAARRELLARHGLFDANVVGSGDSFMVCAMYGWWQAGVVAAHNAALQQAFRDWALPFHRDVLGRVGYVGGEVRHLWHGTRANRKYCERADYLNRHDFDPRTDLAVGPHGLWHWATEKPEMHRLVRRYFEERLEDN